MGAENRNARNFRPLQVRGRIKITQKERTLRGAWKLNSLTPKPNNSAAKNAKAATSPTTNGILAAFKRNPYFMAISYCANVGGLRWRPSTTWRPSKTAIWRPSWRTTFPLCRNGFSRRPPRPPNITEGLMIDCAKERPSVGSALNGAALISDLSAPAHPRAFC